jgi:hypothetical protein
MWGFVRVRRGAEGIPASPEPNAPNRPALALIDIDVSVFQY